VSVNCELFCIGVILWVNCNLFMDVIVSVNCELFVLVS
jgi:hypothetical protein